MYSTDNKPILPLISWASSVNHAYWFPQHETKTSRLDNVDFLRHSLEEGYLTTTLMQRVSSTFKKVQASILGADRQFQRYKDNTNLTSKQLATRLKENMQTRQIALRGALQQMIATLIDQHRKGGYDDLILSVSYIMLTYLMAVKTKDPRLTTPLSRAEKIKEWLRFMCNQSSSPFEEDIKNEKTLLQIFRTRDIQQLANTLQSEYRQIQGDEDYKQLYILLMDLIYYKIKLDEFQIRRSRDNFVESVNRFQKHCELKLLSEPLVRLPDHQIYKIIKVLSGSQVDCKRQANGDWRVYMVLSISYCNPLLESHQLMGKALEFITEKKTKLSEVDKIQLNLIENDFHYAYESSQSILPQYLSCTIGFLAYQLHSFSDAFAETHFQMTYKQHMCVVLTNWMTEVSWQIKLPYLKWYIQAFKNSGKGYLDTVFKILQYTDNYDAVTTIGQLDQVRSYCLDIQQLNLPVNYIVRYLKNLVLCQVRINTFKYMFHLIREHQSYGGVNLTENAYSRCMYQLEIKQLDYKALGLVIQGLPAADFTPKDKLNICKAFYHICLLHEAFRIQNSQQRQKIFLELLGGPFKFNVFGSIVSLVLELIPRHGKAVMEKVLNRLRTLSSEYQLHDQKMFKQVSVDLVKIMIDV